MDFHSFGFAVVGLVVGFMVGLTGMGGGSLMTPTLVLLGLPPLGAVGLDLAYMSITKSGAAFLHYIRGRVNLEIVGYLLLGSIPSALLGYFVLRQVLTHQGSERVNGIVGLALGVIILLVALANLYHIFFRQAEPAEAGTLTGMVKIRLVVIGAIVGAVVQFTSVGSGVLITLFLLRLLPSKLVVGTDVCYGFGIALFSGALHWRLGSADFSLLLPLVAGSIPGMFLGVLVCGRVPSRQLRGALNLLLVAVSVLLLRQNLPLLLA